MSEIKSLLDNNNKEKANRFNHKKIIDWIRKKDKAKDKEGKKKQTNEGN